MATPKKSKHTIEIKDEGNGLFLRKTKEISESLLLAINNGKNGELDKETKLMQDLKHRNVVHLIDRRVRGNKIEIDMEYFPGGTLRNFLNKLSEKGQYLQPGAILKLCTEILNGLVYLHNKKIVHRNLCPENIYLTNDLVSVISNFFSSRILDTSGVTEFVKLNEYQPFEQRTKLYKYEVDVFALGCIWYEIMAHEQLFRKEDIKKEGNTEIKVPAELEGKIPIEFIELIERMVLFNPTERITLAKILESKLITEYTEKSKE